MNKLKLLFVAAAVVFMLGSTPSPALAGGCVCLCDDAGWNCNDMGCSTDWGQCASMCVYFCSYYNLGVLDPCWC